MVHVIAVVPAVAEHDVGLARLQPRDQYVPGGVDDHRGGRDGDGARCLLVIPR